MRVRYKEKEKQKKKGEKKDALTSGMPEGPVSMINCSESAPDASSPWLMSLSLSDAEEKSSIRVAPGN
jgi:hypothetical protein